MKNHFRKCRILFLITAFLFSFDVCAAAAEHDLDAVLTDTARYIYETVSNPTVSTVGGEWSVLGLARSGVSIPDEYYNRYYGNLTEYIKSRNGVLHEKKYTEYSRVIAALTAIGKNPAEVGGYDLLMPLSNYKNTALQGLNGSIWALIALDCGEYELPANNDASVQAVREIYVSRILQARLSDGGWAFNLDGKLSADADITAMALQALSKYVYRDDVKDAVDKALICLSSIQESDGGFSGITGKNSESCAQIIIALTELKIPIDDGRFVKNGNTVLDGMMKYYMGGGKFRHSDNEDVSLMATEQCLCGLAAVNRFNNGQNSLYDMSDAERKIDAADTSQWGLQGKSDDIKRTEVTSAGRTFSDIAALNCRFAIEELAARNIINGKTNDVFEPDSTMTRAEFAAVITRSLGLSPKAGNIFSDVTDDEWFYDAVNTAYNYEIVNGISETEFNPNGIITREESAVMLTRAAKLCGFKTDREIFEARNILAGFLDYVQSSDWAVSSLAFCYDSSIFDSSVTEIKPKEAVNRAEIAQALYNLLNLAELL